MADRALNLRVENARLTAEITALRADLDRTIAERDGARARAYDLAVAIMGGEDAPGYADSVPTEDLVKQARDSELARECEMLTAGMDALRARAEKAEAAAAGLAEALQKLRNEVHALRAFEFGVRDAISNTNWHVLQLRADEADAAIAAYAAT